MADDDAAAQQVVLQPLTLCIPFGVDDVLVPAGQIANGTYSHSTTQSGAQRGV